MLSDRYSFTPDLVLTVDGPAWVRDHFRQEYAAARLEDGAGPPTLRITVSATPTAAPPPDVGGRYRSIAWQAVTSELDALTVEAHLVLTGRPRWFGLSLAQGWCVEPLLSVTAARAGYVLLPAAAVVTDAGALVLMGRSGAGKTSLCARALSAGRSVIGDDQVLVGVDGCRRFPRRMRLYGDLAATAPAAHRTLSTRRRVALHARAAVRRLSKDLVSPPLPVPAEELGRTTAGPLPVARVVLLDRADVDVHRWTDLAVDEAVASGQALLTQQRSHLASADRHRSVLRHTADVEASTLAGVLRSAPARQRLSFPARWSAAEAVDRLATLLELG